MTVLDALTLRGQHREHCGAAAEDRVEFVHGNICDAELLDKIVPGHDAIVHYAAESHNDNSIANPEPFLKTNVEGTFRLLEAARKYGMRYHHVSTDEVYGDLALDDSAKFTESTPVPSVQPVLSTKAASDMLVRAWTRTYRFEDHDLQLLEQLRAAPAHREVHPAPDHQHPRGHPPKLYGQGRERARLIQYTGPLQRRVDHPDPGPYRRDLPDRRGWGAQQHRGAAHDPEDDGPGRGRVRLGQGTARGTTAATRSTARSCGPSSAGSPTHTDFESGLKQTIKWYTDNRDWWEPARPLPKPRITSSRASDASPPLPAANRRGERTARLGGPGTFRCLYQE